VSHKKKKTDQFEKSYTAIYHSFKYNQQDATFIIFFIIVYALHVLGGFSARHQELNNCTHSIWYVPDLLASTASSSSKQSWHKPDAVCASLELLMMGGETAQNM